MESKPDLEYLAHYGVKGMHWGIRKEREHSLRQRTSKEKIPKNRSFRSITKQQKRSGSSNREVKSSAKDSMNRGEVFAAAWSAFLVGFLY